MGFRATTVMLRDLSVVVHHNESRSHHRTRRRQRRHLWSGGIQPLSPPPTGSSLRSLMPRPSARVGNFNSGIILLAPHRRDRDNRYPRRRDRTEP